MALSERAGDGLDKAHQMKRAAGFRQRLDMGNNYSKPLAGQARGLLVDFDDLARFGVDNHAMLVHHRKTVLLEFRNFHDLDRFRKCSANHHITPHVNSRRGLVHNPGLYFGFDHDLGCKRQGWHNRQTSQCCRYDKAY